MCEKAEGFVRPSRSELRAVMSFAAAEHAVMGVCDGSKHPTGP